MNWGRKGIAAFLFMALGISNSLAASVPPPVELATHYHAQGLPHLALKTLGFLPPDAPTDKQVEAAVLRWQILSELKQEEALKNTLNQLPTSPLFLPLWEKAFFFAVQQVDHFAVKRLSDALLNHPTLKPALRPSIVVERIISLLALNEIPEAQAFYQHEIATVNALPIQTRLGLIVSFLKKNQRNVALQGFTFLAETHPLPRFLAAEKTPNFKAEAFLKTLQSDPQLPIDEGSLWVLDQLAIQLSNPELGLWVAEQSAKKTLPRSGEKWRERIHVGGETLANREQLLAGDDQAWLNMATPLATTRPLAYRLLTGFVCLEGSTQQEKGCEQWLASLKTEQLHTQLPIALQEDRLKQRLPPTFKKTLGTLAFTQRRMELAWFWWKAVPIDHWKKEAGWLLRVAEAAHLAGEDLEALRLLQANPPLSPEEQRDLLTQWRRLILPISTLQAGWETLKPLITAPQWHAHLDLIEGELALQGHRPIEAAYLFERALKSGLSEARPLLSTALNLAGTQADSIRVLLPLPSLRPPPVPQKPAGRATAASRRKF